VTVAYVYPNSRARLRREIERGEAPDTGLLGLNHLHREGLDAVACEPLLQRHPLPGPLRRIGWSLRELTLPWEVARGDVLCSALGPLTPLAARAHRGPATILFNMGLCARLARSSRRRERLLAAGIRDASAVVCFAESQRERLIAQTGCDPEHVHTLQLGVDERFLAADEPPPVDGPVLAVGRDLARDYATLGEAARGLDAEVVVVASEKNVRDIRFPSNVRVRLDISALELRELYRRARCVVLPTRSEAFEYGADCSGQNVLLDAMAMSRPVIASERSTLDGYVEDGETAVLVAPEDPAALTEAIGEVLAAPEAAEQMGARARRQVETRFTTRRFAARLARLIRTLGAG
jgi:glycosyltransferase involved in cell wall biosynthesis